MADSKVSALTAATAVAGSDVLYFVDGGVSKKITVSQFRTNPGFTGTFTHTGQQAYFGTEDAANATIHVYGGAAASNEGGQLNLYTAADYDATIDFWSMDAWQDQLRFLTSTGGLAAYFTAGRRFVINVESAHLDSKPLRFGTGDDAYIWHDGSNTTFQNTTGVLYLNGYETSGEVRIQSYDSVDAAHVVIKAGAATPEAVLYYDSLPRISSSNVGAVVQRSGAQASLQLTRTDTHGSGQNVGVIDFYGKDTAAATEQYGRIGCQVIDDTAGSEDSYFYHQLKVAGTISTSLIDNISSLTKYSYNGQQAIIQVNANHSHGSAVTIAKYEFLGKDSGAAAQSYAHLECYVDDDTAASEDARIRLFTTQAGTSALRGYVGLGLVMGSPTGGDKGAGTINATAVYDDNVLLTDFVYDYYLDGEIKSEDASQAERFMDDPNIVDLDYFAKRWKLDRSLPTHPSREEFNDERMSTGALGRMNWEAIELLSIHIDQLNARLKTLEKVAA